jgi:hypothetical protein
MDEARYHEMQRSHRRVENDLAAKASSLSTIGQLRPQGLSGGSASVPHSSVSGAMM